MSSIFISHSSQDNATATQLNAWLAQQGHRSVFLDFDPENGIPAGRDWEKELYRNIRSCRAVIALCSAHWLSSRWCFMEFTYARALGKQVFPIKIDDSPLNDLLSDTQLVDFTKDQNDARSRLWKGLLAAGLDPADAFDRDVTRPAYPGLLAFQEADAAIFFGRDAEIGDGLDLLNKCHRLGDTHLVLVLGASGSGKSSLARAGMLPRLRRDTTRWLVLEPFRPRDDPDGELVGVLSHAFDRAGAPRREESLRQALSDTTRTYQQPKASPDAQPSPDISRFLDALGTAESSLPETLRLGLAEPLRRLKAVALRAGDEASLTFGAGRSDSHTTNPLDDLMMSLRRSLVGSDASVLVTIDQFEELLGHPPDHPSSRFLRLLGDSLRRGGAFTVLATMRSDFLGHFQQTEALAGLRYESLSLGAMSPDAIAQVIERPAELSGITLGPGLVQSLVEDARAQDALPLLAFTLHELTERYGGDGDISLDEYKTGLGGIQAALAKSAEALIVSEAPTPQTIDDLRRAFLRMVRVTEQGAFSRRVAHASDVPDGVRPLLKKFVDARLLVTRGEGSDAVIEVAHEAIFKSWTRLADWLKDSAAALRLREQIAAAARAWDEAGRPDEDLLRGGRLVHARELREKGEVPLEPIECTFVDQSIAADQARLIADQRRRRRRMLGLATAAILGITLSIVAGVSAVRARQAQEQADIAARAAEEREREALISAARAKAAQNFAEHQRVRARIPGIEPGSFQARALEALAPKYLEQAKAQLAEVAKLEAGLAQWKAQVGAAADPIVSALSVEFLQARNNGNAVLLHYGDPTAPRLMVVDGGDRPAFTRVIKPRLLALQQQRSANAPLPIDLVVSSQTDFQHMDGLIRFVGELADTSTQPFARINTLWSNAFIPPTESFAQDPVDVQRKAALIVDARRLGIPINTPFSKLVTLPEAGVARVHWNEGLSITVLGPSLESLRVFARQWLANWRKRDQEDSSADAPLDTIVDDLTLESFADPSLELIPSPLEIVRPEVPRDKDGSFANLGSIAMLVELAGKRILLPADSRGDLLTSALAQAGYTDAQGNVSLDVMALPRGGSEQNVSLQFFQRVRADHYVFQADGTFRNPNLRTLKMLFDARRADRRPFTLHFTFAPEQFKKEYPIDGLCKMLDDERTAGTLFRLMTPQKDQTSTTIQLLRPSPQLPEGVESTCRSPSR